MKRTIPIQHPYFEQVTVDGERCVVKLRADFPVASFSLQLVEPVWEGYLEVASDTGIKNESGQVEWVRGTGKTFDEAVEDALVMFVNLVVHPGGLNEKHFVRNSAA